MLEEMATYWPMWMTMNVFVCTSVAAFTMQLIGQGRAGSDTNALLGDHAVLATTWHKEDLPIFVFLGLATGLYSSMLGLCCKKVFTVRRFWTKRLGGYIKLYDMAFLTVLATTISTFLPLLFSCSPHLASSNNSTRNLASADEPLQYTCGDNFYSQMASITHGLPEGNVLKLWTKGSEFDATVLLVYLVSFSVQFCLLPGLYNYNLCDEACAEMSLLAGASIPMGTTVPSILIGALLGRFVGEVLHMTKWSYLFASPAVFSQVGAAGVLSGYTHM